jgi:hypothetical protein
MSPVLFCGEVLMSKEKNDFWPRDQHPIFEKACYPDIGLDEIMLINA